MTNLLETLIDYSEKLYIENNYKTHMVEYHHKKKWKEPRYEVLYEDGKSHADVAQGQVATGR